MPKAKTDPKTTDRDILVAVGLEAILEKVVEGASQAEVAVMLGVKSGSVSTFLNEPANADQSARARAMSAESWLDRGLHTLKRAMNGAVDPTAAKAYAQECARRAAIRNPRYVERTAHEVTGAGGGPIQQAVLSKAEFTDIAKQIAQDV